MGAPPVGLAIAFMLFFVMAIVVGVCVLAYAARSVLVIVQETGAGQDEIVWPKEPYVDWLVHAVQFLELVGIWLAPAAVAARSLRDVLLPDDGVFRVVILAVPGLWLFFPIGLMSSLSAQSRWVPFRWTMFLCFLRVGSAAMVFYLVTAFVLAAAVVPWYYVFFAGRGILLPVAAVVTAAMLFIYARLLGRLAWIIQRLPATERAPATARVEKQARARRKKKRKPSREEQDPWAVPEDEEREREKSKRYPWAKPQRSGYKAPSAEEIEGYGIAKEQPAVPETPPEKPARSRFAMSPEEHEPYGMKDAAEPEPSRPPQSQDDPFFADQVRQHIAERARIPPKLPPHPFLSGVYTFPFYGASAPNWLALTLAFLIEGLLLQQVIDFGSQLFRA